MKKVVVIVVVVMAVVLMLRAKMVERDRVTEAVSDFFHAECKGSASCGDRLVMLRPCTAEAYSMSLIPGADTVDMDALIDCLNGRYPLPSLEALRDRKTPFPSKGGGS